MIVLVGLGYWGSKLLRNLVTILGAENVVAVDESIERLDTARAAYPGVRCASSLERALEDPAVRGVVVATPVSTHARLVRLALRSGRAVLVEKPLAGSVADAHELASMASNLGLTLMVGHTFLFSPRVELIARYLQEGRLGTVHYATLSRLALGPYRSDVSAIWDLAPHDFAILFHLLGEYPTTVQAAGRSITRAGSPDVAFINLQFASGVIGQVSVSWLAPRKIRSTIIVGDSKMLVYDDTDADEPIKVHDKGIVVLEGPTFGENQLTYRTGDTLAPHVSAQEPLAIELAHFVDCVRRGTACKSDAWFGLRVVEALEAADLSYRSGGLPIEIKHRSAKVPA